MAGLALSLGPHANADTLYTYQGNPFTTILFSPAFTNDSIQVELTFASPLPQNMALSTPDDLLAFNITVGDYAIQYLDSDIEVATDAAGAISEWLIDTESNLGNNTSNPNSPRLIIDTFNSPTGVEDVAAVVAGNLGLNVSAVGYILSDPGNWSSGTPVPEPGGYLPSVLGAVVFGLLEGQGRITLELAGDGPDSAETP
jgi:hypothetical protein